MRLYKIVDTHPLTTACGEFLLDVFYDGRQEAAVLRPADVRDKDVRDKEEVLCRVQSKCMNHDFLDVECDCREQMACSLKMIDAAEGPQTGLVILLPQEGKGNGFAARDYREVEDLRDYRIAAEIIKHYRIRSILLVSSNKRKIARLEERGVVIRKKIWYRDRYFLFNPALERTVSEIKLGHAISPIRYERRGGAARTGGTAGGESAKIRVLVCGDLNIDHFIDRPLPGQKNRGERLLVGGTAYNACRAFQHYGFMPVLFGAVGDDKNGLTIQSQLKLEPYHVVIRVNRDVVNTDKPEMESVGDLGSVEKPQTKSTGLVYIHWTGDSRHPFNHEWDTVNNANDYNAEYLLRTMVLMGLNERDLVFITSYLFLQKGWDIDACRDFFSHLKASKARVVLDLARSSFKAYETTEGRKFKVQELLKRMADIKPLMVTGDFEIFLDLFGQEIVSTEPGNKDYVSFLETFEASYIHCRYKSQGHVYEDTYYLDQHGLPKAMVQHEELKREALPWSERRGFGDFGTAAILKQILANESTGVGR